MQKGMQRQSQISNYIKQLWITAFLLLTIASTAAAEFPKPSESRSYKPYPPVEVTSLVYTEPRPLRAWVVKIDLSDPTLEIVVTGKGDVGEKLETASQNTYEFAKEKNAQIAINASFFNPLRSKPGEGMNVLGLGMCDGETYSPADDARCGALVFDKEGNARILEPPVKPEQLKGADDAVSGFRMWVKNGVSLAPKILATVPPKFADVNPRSAVGLSKDRKTMWLIAIDGRLEGYSEGIKLAELADLGVQLGCDRLLNLDGGGSTTLVIQDPASKEFRIINKAAGKGTPDGLRLVANNLGIRIRQQEKEDK